MLPNVDPSTGVRDTSVRLTYLPTYALICPAVDSSFEPEQIPWSVMQDFRVCEPENSSNYCWGSASTFLLFLGR